MNKKLTAIDLFCGAGGLSEGFRQAGFSILVGNDIDKAAGATFSATHPEAKFILGPISEIKSRALMKTAGVDKGELTCLIGGPPCQAFSVYNHQRGMHDERSHLFKEYLRIVKDLMPEWIVMENVTGILSVGGGAAVTEICDGLEEIGYDVEFRTLKAEEFGVPQERRRVFFVGNRVGKPISWPTPTHGEGLLPLVTIKDAIWDLPKLKNGESYESEGYRTHAISDYQVTVRGNSPKVLNHSAPKLGDINLERMKHISQGGSWRDIPINLLPQGMKKAKRSDHTKRYGRMRWNGLSCTVLTKCDVHWGAFIHPAQNRSITVREAARLQSFPDSFEFLGSRTEQYVQVGNAVPPLLGRCMAKAVLQSNKRSSIKESSNVNLNIAA
jgi:DNA (cytosine-5)-methyltransferase 1